MAPDVEVEPRDEHECTDLPHLPLYSFQDRLGDAATTLIEVLHSNEAPRHRHLPTPQPKPPGGKSRDGEYEGNGPCTGTVEGEESTAPRPLVPDEAEVEVEGEDGSPPEGPHAAGGGDKALPRAQAN